MNWRMSWRALTHRFVAVPLALFAIVVAWNIYIAFNDHGIIEGEVRDKAGAPATGDGRKSERRQLRLWFRSQDTEVPPLVVEAPRA